MPPKRKAINGDKLGNLHAELGDNPTAETLMAFAAEVGKILKNANKKAKVTTAASKLEDINTSVAMFGLEYHPLKKEHVLTLEKDDEPVEVGLYLVEAIDALWRSFWQIHSAEALCRTPVDLLLNERMGRLVKKYAFKEMCLLGEKHMDAKRADKDEWISGDMDHVIGYGGDNFRFDANLAVVAPKHQKSLSSGVAQCIAYLVGLSQKRAEQLPPRMVNTVHGIVSHGTEYIFLRLDGKKLSISETMSIRGLPNSKCFYRTVNLMDHVLESAQQSTPHTTPVNEVDATSEAAYKLDRDRLSNRPIDFTGQNRLPPAAYIVDWDEEAEEDEETEVSHYERTPSKSTLQLRPVYRPKSGSSRDDAEAKEGSVGGPSVA